MTFRHFKLVPQKLILFVFAGMLPVVAKGAAQEGIAEKRMSVTMRMIGHEVLMCLGDYESRIMPIEKIDERYKIPFESKFEFDPSDIVSIIDHVMTETSIATNYLVEVEQCETKAVVHSFEIRNTTNIDLIACKGRMFPKDCYSLFITILDGTRPKTEELSSDALFLTSSIVLLLFLIGFIAYFFNKKNVESVDPNLIFIGASQFDKRNMALSFEDKRVELSNKEAALLSLLHTSANTPIEREVILQRVWGDEGDYVGRTLDVFISKLRKKLEADASVKIVNIRGVGYKLVMDV